LQLEAHRGATLRQQENDMTMMTKTVMALLMMTSLYGCASSWPATPVEATELVHLDGSKGSMSEGIAIRGNTAYFAFAGSGQVVTVDIDSHAVTPYSSLPQPVANKGFVSGLALNGNDLFGGLVSFAPEVQPGIYRATAAGAPATLFAKHPDMVFPNGLLFDDGGQLYVTDSAAGAVFRISPTGEVTRWASDALLTGAKDTCGPNSVGVPFDIGANGIVLKNGAFYVSNTDRATIVRIPLLADGSAGAPATFAGPSCAELGGADGMAVAPNGDIIVAVNHQNKLVRVDGAGHVSPLVASSALDFPTSLTFAGGALYITNLALLDAKNPGLLRVR
jgi:sugar lactone lactonase YvrE